MTGLSRKHAEWLSGFGFLLPNLTGFLIFTSVPVIASLVLSLYDWDMFHAPTFVGLDNFKEMLALSYKDGSLAASDPDFWYSTFNTAFLMLSIPLEISLSLLLAMLLNRKLRGGNVLEGQMAPAAHLALACAAGLLVFVLVGSVRGQWLLAAGLGLIAAALFAVILGRAIVSARVMFFLPSITAGVAIYLMWMWLFNSDGGPINRGLNAIGLQGPEWLNGAFTTAGADGQPKLWWFWAKPAIMIMGVWIAMGGTNMILYLAALQGIDPQLYEAAEIDGAGGWQKFWHVTLPLLAPTTFFISVTSVIGGFQGGFGAAYVMTTGGPENSTTTISYYIFRQAFEFFRMGYAAALAWVLFAMVFIFTIILWRMGGKGTVH